MKRRKNTYWDIIVYSNEQMDVMKSIGTVNGTELGLNGRELKQILSVVTNYGILLIKEKKYFHKNEISLEKAIQQIKSVKLIGKESIDILEPICLIKDRFYTRPFECTNKKYEGVTYTFIRGIDEESLQEIIPYVFTCKSGSLCVQGDYRIHYSIISKMYYLVQYVYTPKIIVVNKLLSK